MPDSQSAVALADVPPAPVPSIPKLLHALPPKRRAFVERYMLDLNATKAYQDVYGVSKESAYRAGPRLLGIVGVAEAIAELQARRTVRLEVTGDEIVAEIDRLSLSDPTDMWDMSAEKLRLLPMKLWPLAARRAVASIKVKHYPVKFPEMSSERIARLEAIARAGKDSPYVEPMKDEDRAFLERLADDLRESDWGQDEVLEIRLWNKTTALKHAGDHRRLFHEAKRDGKGEGEPDILVRLDF